MVTQTPQKTHFYSEMSRYKASRTSKGYFQKTTLNEFRYTSQNPDEIVGLPFMDRNASEDYSLLRVPDARPDLHDNFFSCFS